MAGNFNCEESSSAPYPQEEASQNSQVDERQAFVLLTFLLFHALNSILNEDVLFEWKLLHKMKARQLGKSW